MASFPYEQQARFLLLCTGTLAPSESDRCRAKGTEPTLRHWHKGKGDLSQISSQQISMNISFLSSADYLAACQNFPKVPCMPEKMHAAGWHQEPSCKQTF